MDVGEIQRLKTYYVERLYSTVRSEQAVDETYYRDTFPVPQLDESVNISRTGHGADIIDNPVEQIVSGKLSVYRKAQKETQSSQASANRITKLINEVWLNRISRRALVKEFVKNQFLRGEAWIHPLHNQSWAVAPYSREGMPVIFLIPDPMIIFASPNEDENGIPENVVVFYQRSPQVIQTKYPAWTNPNRAGSGDSNTKETVTWLEYWDKDQRYFEADDEAVLGPQKNIYGFVPFIHANAGFGKLNSPDGKMEDIIVSRLKKERNLLQRECAITSDVDYVIHTFSNRSIDVQPNDDQHHIPADFRDKYEIGTGMIHEIPPGITVKRSEEMLPEQQLFQYLYSLKTDIGNVTPKVLGGSPVGASGRLQDMTYATAMKRWEGIVKNTENAFSTAFGIALQMIEKIPKLRPDEINEGDINEYYEVTCQLKSDDPAEEDRVKTMGSRLYQAGEIDLMENLIKYQGYTQERAKEIITNIMVEKVTFQNPMVAELMGLIAADEMGMAEDYNIIRQRRQMVEKQQTALMQTPTPTEQTRNQGEVKTPMGQEMMDAFMGGYGSRKSPTNYQRGQP